jgi:hypothetical protein
MNAVEAIKKIKLLKIAREKLPGAWDYEVNDYIDRVGIASEEDDPFAGTEGMVEEAVLAIDNEISRIRQYFDGIDLGV